MGQYLKNCWYIAAWSHEISTELLARTLLERKVLLWRASNGVAMAMADRCPHRFAPLSLGKREGDHVVCAYHGLAFGPDGKCVHNPHGNHSIPTAAKLRTYPLEERYGAAWIWMGGQDKADLALIPDFSFLDNEVTRRAVRGQSRLAANYRIIIDNLMDLSHVEYLHGGTFAVGVMETAKQTIVQEPGVVTSTWWSANVDNPPLLEKAFAAKGQKVDHWLEMRWQAPTNLRLETGVTLAGRPREEGGGNLQAHCLTPESEGSTHYFWAMSRTEMLDNEEYSAMIVHVLSTAFDVEDKPMVEAIQGNMEMEFDDGDVPVLLEIDSAAARAERVLGEMIRSEYARD